jgi:hypothetical protein
MKNLIQDGKLPHFVLPSFVCDFTAIFLVSGLGIQDQQNYLCEVLILPHVIFVVRLGQTDVYENQEHPIK